MRAARRLASDDPPTPQHENAAEVLGAIARARACPLTRGLVHPNAITLLARHAFAHGPRPRRVQVPSRPSGLGSGLGSLLAKDAFAQGPRPRRVQVPKSLTLQGALLVT